MNCTCVGQLPQEVQDIAKVSIPILICLFVVFPVVVLSICACTVLPNWWQRYKEKQYLRRIAYKNAKRKHERQFVNRSVKFDLKDEGEGMEGEDECV